MDIVSYTLQYMAMTIQSRKCKDRAMMQAAKLYPDLLRYEKKKCQGRHN